MAALAIERAKSVVEGEQGAMTPAAEANPLIISQYRGNVPIKLAKLIVASPAACEAR